MTFTGAVAPLIPGMMTLSLMGKSAQAIPGYWGPQKGKKGKRPSMIKSFTEIMVGVPLIGATANLTSGL